MTDSEYAADDAGFTAEARTLDLGRCLRDAVDFFKANVLLLLVAAFVVSAVSFVTLSILAGPMVGGWITMVRNAWDRADRKVQLGDLFGAFDRLPGLIGLFYLCLLLSLVGLIGVLVGSIVVSTCLIFSFFIFMNHGRGAIDSVKESFRIVFPQHLLWLLALVCIAMGMFLCVFVIDTIVSWIPLFGFLLAFPLSVVLNCAAVALCWGLLYSAYVQLVRETGAAGPVTAAGPAPASSPPPADEAPTA